MKSKVRITYKSGESVVVKCDNFTAVRNRAGELTAVKWDNIHPRPIYVNVSAIESIWVLK